MSTPHTPPPRTSGTTIRNPTTTANVADNLKVGISAPSVPSSAHNAALNAPSQRIHPLPNPVSTRIQTSLVHTTLPSVLRSLLQNSLDASAPTISFTLAPQRRAITVTDTAAGILPDELPLVGKLHHTSKTPASTLLFGSKGISLAALGTHSVLTVTSRAEGWRSTWTKRRVYGRELGVTREGTGDGAQEVGTRVRVEGMWGDMPVRARQDIDAVKAWDDISRVVVETLCARRGGWRALTKLIGRDENGAVKVHVRRAEDESEPWDLRVLRQVWGVDTAAWEPVRGKLGGVRIDGWICNVPVMGRKWQVVLADGMPDEEGLVETVNRGFRNAGFENGVEKNAGFLLRVEGVKEGGERGRAEAEELCRRLVAEWLKVRLYKPAREKSNFTLPQKRKPEADEQPKTLRRGRGKENTRPAPTPSKISSFFAPSKPGTRPASSKPATPTAPPPAPKPKVLKPVFPAPPADPASIISTDRSGQHHLLDPRTGNLQRRAPTSAPARLTLPPSNPTLPLSNSTLPPTLPPLLPHTFPPPHPPPPPPPPHPPTPHPLTRHDLAHSRLIGQIDRKLLLLHTGRTLTILDQHAASERIRLEHLYATLSTTPIPLPSPLPLPTPLPPARRAALASWGVLTTPTHLLALPQILLDRRARPTWLAALVDEDVQPRRDGEDWVLMMRRVPRALREVVESRSCRGAVMFGDVLTREEACEMVRRLAGCRWPWICAHGRRGVVPILAVGEGAGAGRSGVRRGAVGRVVRERLGGEVDWRGFGEGRRGGGAVDQALN